MINASHNSTKHAGVHTSVESKTGYVEVIFRSYNSHCSVTCQWLTRREAWHLLRQMLKTLLFGGNAE